MYRDIVQQSYAINNIFFKIKYKLMYDILKHLQLIYFALDTNLATHSAQQLLIIGGVLHINFKMTFM